MKNFTFLILLTFSINQITYSQIINWAISYDVINANEYHYIVDNYIDEIGTIAPNSTNWYTFSFDINGGSIINHLSKAIGYTPLIIIIDNQTGDRQSIEWNRNSDLSIPTTLQCFLKNNHYYSVYLNIGSFGGFINCDDLIFHFKWYNYLPQELSSNTLTLILSDYVSETWTYQKRVQTVNNADVYMRDWVDWSSSLYYMDLGNEPEYDWWASQFRPITKSPDLWVRWYADGNEEPQNPKFATLPGNSNKVYYKVTNRSCQVSEPVNLRLYWTFARTNEMWDNDWIYSLVNNSINGQPAGSEITIEPITSYSSPSSPVVLPAINPGNVYKGYHEWLAPNPALYPDAPQHTSSGRPVICFLARIESNWDYMYQEINPNPVFENVYKNNNIVTRNTWMATTTSGYYVGPIDDKYYSELATFYINNPVNNPHNISISTKDYSDTNLNSLPEYANIYLFFENPILDEIINETITGTGFQIINDSVIQILDLNNFSINNIELSSGDQSLVALQFEYFAPAPDSNLQFTFEIGDINTLTTEFNSTPIEFVTDIFYEPFAEYSEFPLPEPEQITAIIEKFNTNSISIYPNPVNDNLDISLELYENEIFEITIYDILNKVYYHQPVAEYQKGSNFIKICTSLLNPGIYFVEFYSKKGKITKRFTKI